ncbi:hypothetical protein TSAR_016995 [Trichomalopsis sarcophagae]|uniref:Uncharacterized protein n=1 Tax=Trichomalopsis sarcophagae TaxID=543379 RepID=A0A232EIB7_9HYME|nr:hypothetical protein TSAR_016995 [Trichomalopsis sarcophagae]
MATKVAFKKTVEEKQQTQQVNRDNDKRNKDVNIDGTSGERSRGFGRLSLAEINKLNKIEKILILLGYYLRYSEIRTSKQ